MNDDLTRLEEWIGGLASNLSPAQRTRLAAAIGRALRRENARRIAANVDPEGGAMAPRKPRLDRRTGQIRSRGKMFPRIRLATALRVNPGPDGVEVGFNNPAIAEVAAVHHFGDVGYVGKTPGGRVIRTRYEARRLLGFAPSDIEGIEDLVIAALAPD